jgi:3-deoxy-D-manno-octulosonic-acid transferase
VPRHPQRFDEVATLCASCGLRVARRSRGEQPAPEHHVYLGDTMGEMAFYYAACDLAVIGGSFAPLGGQNLIEALAAGAPALFGPSMYNFAEASRLALEAGAARQAAGAVEAMNVARELLGDAAARARMAQAGRALCAAHRGATRRHLEVVRRLLGAAASAPAPR